MKIITDYLNSIPWEHIDDTQIPYMMHSRSINFHNSLDKEKMTYNRQYSVTFKVLNVNGERAGTIEVSTNKLDPEGE